MASTRDHSAISTAPSINGVELLRASFTRFSYARHTHDTFALGAVDRGVMQFWHSRAMRVAPTTSVIAINPGEVHDGSAAIPEGCTYRLFYVEPSIIESLFETETRLADLMVLRRPLLEDAQLARALNHLHRSFDGERRFPAEPLAQQSVFAQVLFTLFSRHGNAALSSPKVDVGKRHVARAKDYMAAHLSDRVELNDLAAACGLSQFYLIRLFKRVTGLSPHSHLFQIRLEQARRLLRQGEAPAQVAAAVGFADQSHLTHRFKAAFGVTPGQYAAAHRS